MKEIRAGLIGAVCFMSLYFICLGIAYTSTVIVPWAISIVPVAYHDDLAMLGILGIFGFFAGIVGSLGSYSDDWGPY